MADTSSRSGRPTSRKGKVRKEFLLDPTLLKEAQRILGTATEGETVETALDLAAFRRELAESAETLSDLKLRHID